MNILQEIRFPQNIYLPKDTEWNPQTQATETKREISGTTNIPILTHTKTARLSPSGFLVS